MQAIVNRVIELPKSDHAGEFDNLWRIEVLFESIENLIRHGCRIGRRGAHIIETDAFEFSFRWVSTSDDRLKLRFIHSPAFEIVATRLLQHRAAVRGAVSAAIDRTTHHRKLALEELIKR